MDDLQRTAQARIRFLEWLARKLIESDHAEYRREASEALLQIVECATSDKVIA